MTVTAAKSKVLYVEDHEDQRDIIAQQLELRGYRVDVASTGEEGVRKAQEWHPDVILMDLYLPIGKIHGIEAIRQLRSNPDTANTRIIVVTAWGTSDRRKSESVNAGADEYFIKPVEPDDLVAAIDGAVEESIPYKSVESRLPPGFRLRHTFRGHMGCITRIAWSPDGRTIASPSRDGTVRLWDSETGELCQTLKGHSGPVYSVAWSPDGRTLASGSRDKTIRLWDAETGRLRWTFQGHSGQIHSVTWSPDGRILASGSNDKTIRLWDVARRQLRRTLQGHSHDVYSTAWSPSGRTLASGSWDRTIRLWDAETGELRRTLEGYFDWIYCVAWSPDGRILASVSADKIVRLWDPDTGRLMSVLEGHTSLVTGICFAHDGSVLSSVSWDNTVRLWRYDNWEMIASLKVKHGDNNWQGLAFHPKAPALATLDERDTILRIWDLDLAELLGGELTIAYVRYTTAKIVLVGDSGVGKTGLGWRLAHDAFREHSSSHGQQFWVIDELGMKRADDTECEAVLWDLAGQPDYRLIHALYLDDVDLALVLFDATSRQDPLRGVNYWLKQLRRGAKGFCRTILVGARTDRGTATLTKAELEAYCQQQGISGGCIATSALTGEGIPELMAQIKGQIPWEEMTTTVTTTTFKRIKEYVLSLKEDKEQSGVLVSPTALRQRLKETDPDWEFGDEEMMTAVRHLETHGYVTVLRGSKGNVSILLTPDLLTNLASSFVLEARRNPRGLGALEEDRLLHGEYSFPELAGLTEEERKTLLDATTVLFLEHNICFRETFNERTLLVFPSLINEKRPNVEDIETFEDVSYRVSGAVENVYPLLVVLLGYTNMFMRRNQWQNQAQYQLGEGEICGFRQTAEREGEIELVLYYALDMPQHVQLLFQGLFERFLSRRDLTIARYQPVVCSNSDCGERLARNVVMSQLERRRDFILCYSCGEKLTLPAIEELTSLPRREEERLAEQQAVAMRRTAFEAALVRVKGLLRDRKEEKRPTCFISYAWGVPEHERWVVRLAKDMQNAGISVLLDRWHCPPGYPIGRFIDQIEKSEFVVVVGTPKLRQKYETQESDPVVASELELVNLRLRQPTRYGRKVIPLLLDGEPHIAFTPQLQDLTFVNFQNEAFYFVNLFDLIWRLYELPFDNPLLEELRAFMD